MNNVLRNYNSGSSFSFIAQPAGCVLRSARAAGACLSALLVAIAKAARGGTTDGGLDPTPESSTAGRLTKSSRTIWTGLKTPATQ
jgi:hypothetical protein